MHILTLDKRIRVTATSNIEPGEYVVDDIMGAQLLIVNGGGKMRPMPEERPKTWRERTDKILFVRAGGFGDLVLLTPVLREHKRRNPNGKVGVATMEHYAPVLECLPFIDEILPYPLPIARLEEWHHWVFYENAVERNPRAKVLHMTDLFAEIAGVPMDGSDMKPDYRVKASEAMWAAEQYSRTNGTRRVCVNLDASAALRRAPPSLASPIVSKLLKGGWEVFLLGDRPMKLPDGAPKNLRNLTTEKLTFRQSCAVLNGADAMIGVDSAILHVAGALGVPAVGLYGPFPWELRTKYCPTTFSFHGAPKGPMCPCFFHTMGIVGRHFPEDCPTRANGICGVMDGIDPERVVAKVEQIARTIP